MALVDRGADAVAAGGTVSRGVAAELKQEARTRVENGTFFGHTAYVSVLARQR